MRFLKNLLLLFFVISFTETSFLFSMDNGEQEKTLAERLTSFSLEDNSFYDSDSEDEEGYEYTGYSPAQIPQDCGSECLVLFRGIYFSPTYYNKQQISKMRRATDTGNPVYALAESDSCGLSLSEEEEREVLLEECAVSIREYLRELGSTEKILFYSYYKNSHTKFLEQVRNPYIKLSAAYKSLFSVFNGLPKILNKKPVVSTSELLDKSLLYGFGKYISVDGTEVIDPKYDESGKPKHPYLGKIYVLVVNTSEIEELDPCFVVYEYTNNPDSRFGYLKVYDREVAFPGFVPGRNVAFSKTLRVPSFSGEYKSYYEQKYGINEYKFKYIKEQLARNNVECVKSLIDDISKFTTKKLREHIDRECWSNEIKIVYKGIDGGFSSESPSLDSMRNTRKALKG